MSEVLIQENSQLAELYETADQLVDHVSHEFRTPLTVIKEFATIIRDGLVGQVNPKQREFLDIVNDRADDLALMVDDMLDASKLQAGALSIWQRRTQLEEIIRQVQPLLERKAAVKKSRLEISIPPQMPDVFCDPDKIGRVLVGLASHVIKFSDKGNSTRVWARHDPDESEVVVGILDRATKIDPEDIERAFKRFHPPGGFEESSTKGLGLSLCVAQELVLLNLGQIKVDGRPDRESTFSFSLPEFNPSALLLRYLASLERTSESFDRVTLAVAETSPRNAGLSTLVDEFLQHLFRGRDDLVLQVAPHKWLVLVGQRSPQAADLSDHVQWAWTECSRSSPLKGTLGEIAFALQGTWCPKTQADELTHQFAAQLPPS